jgi:anti-sigma-K factor RskA
MNRMDDKLSALWAEYRGAVPDPEPGSDFTPRLWQKIEARRAERTTWLFRRMAQICVMATLALTIVVSAILMPEPQNSELFYSGTYVDILAEDHANDYSQVLPAGDLP